MSLAAAPASAQSNVYRPPNDGFIQSQPAQSVQGRRFFRQNQGSQPVVQNFQQGQTFQQGQIYQQGQPYQTVPQYQTVPNPPQYSYPQQTPVFQQPLQEIPGQVIPQESQSAPAADSSESVELKRSLVKARDLMQKYQIKLEDVTRRNQELESEITNLQQSGQMSDSSAQELAAAKEQMSGLDNQLQNALRDLQTSTGDLERQKQIGAELQEQVISLQKTAQMAAGSDEQVAELTRNLQQSKAQNDELNGKMVTLENALREKDTQIASMGSDGDSQLADLRELLEESETNNKDLSMRLKTAEERASQMAEPQADPAVDQLRADNQQLGQQNQELGQQNQRLQSENDQLNGMIGELQSQNSDLDATVTRLSNMPPPVEATGFAAAPPAASPDLTGLQNELASVTRKNGQLKRQLKLSKSKYASLTDENARLMEVDDAEPIEVAAAPVAVAPIKAAPVAVAVPELGLDSVSGGWPVKYWIFGMLGIGLAVGLGVAWYESVVDPKGLRRTSLGSSNHGASNPSRPDPNHGRPNPGTSNQ